MGQIEGRLEEVAKLIQSDQDAAALRLHVEEILDSPSFSTSKRCGRFLQYIVEKAISQEIDALKERTIGVEVFHRPPDYDTGEDAVVRVTASDVRRRLAQHYGKEGRASEFKISLPPGGYAPEILRDPPPPSRTLETMLFSPMELPVKSIEPLPVVHEPGGKRFQDRRIFVAAMTVLLLGLLGGAAVMFTRHRSATHADGGPWSLLFSAGHPLYVVLSDPDLNEIQILTGKSVSVPIMRTAGWDAKPWLPLSITSAPTS
jgi:hypothetical protein